MKTYLKTTIDKLSLYKELWDCMPNFYIAGGYIRDQLLGTEPKDVDVFCYYKDMNKVCNRLEVSRKTRYSRGNYGVDPQVVSVHSGTSPLFNKRVDIVGLCREPRSAQNLFDRFYCSLSDVSYGHEGIFIGEEFMDDIKANRMTIRKRPWTARRRINTKVEQLLSRYPNLVVNDLRPAVN